MTTNKFLPTSGNITRFFALLIALLLLASVLMIHNAINVWFTTTQNETDNIASSIQKRIDTYRFATWQIYENLAATEIGSSPQENIQETQISPDVYALEKNRQKTEALIFGSHNTDTLGMSLRISNYLDTLWGAETSNWSMYFLNGQDNSLTMVSTLPLRDMATRYKDNTISNLVEAHRTGMLQQANALDERESFSPLRRLGWQDDYYFILRTTFNQPGHLATVVAFDLPVNDLVPSSMKLENFELYKESTPDGNSLSGNQSSTHFSWFNPGIELSSALTGTPLQLIYHVQVTQLLTDTLRSLFWPLLVNVCLLILSVSGLFLLRQQPAHSGESQGTDQEPLRQLTEEIIAALPVGLLVYDFANNRTLLSNNTAEHLLPHLNLQNIINIAEPHQGVLQATVNNEVYEVRHTRSVISPHTQLFIMRNLDRELLVNKKLQQAQQVLDKNHQARQQLLQNLGHTLHQPLHALLQQLLTLSDEYSVKTLNQSLVSAQTLEQLVDDIVLLNQLESQNWVANVQSFSLQALLDNLAREILPAMQRKGLTLMIANHLDSDELRQGDQHAIEKILLTLLRYSITTTTWGRISITVKNAENRPDLLVIDVVDTGSGLSAGEVANTDFPFLESAHQDRFGQASGMAFFLCKLLCKQLNGQFDIHTSPDIGSRYSIQLPLPAVPRQEQEEKLLEGVNVLIDITAEDVHKIVVHQLEGWGANCITPDERFSGQEHDVLLTDEPARMTDWSLLLTDNEPGFTSMAPGQYRVNFNISSAMQDALLQLIEQQLTQEESVAENLESQETMSLLTSGYFQLFVDTVPDDVRRLYSEATNREYSALAQTAHRLKGVFAMLNMLPGKQLCEELEQNIRECNDTRIQNTTSEIDQYVNELLQQGNPSNE